MISNKKNIFEFTPSVLWFFFMAIPFVIQALCLDLYQFKSEIIIVLSVGIILFLADFFCYDKNVTNQTSSNLKKSFFADFYSFIAFFPLIIHLFVETDIPIITKFFHNPDFSTAELAVMRDFSSKLLDIPLIFKYLNNWLIVIFCPLSIYYLFSTQRKLIAFFCFIFLSFYAVHTLAKFPLIEIIGSSFFLFLFSRRIFYTKILFFLKKVSPYIFVLCMYFLYHEETHKQFSLNESYYDSLYSVFDADDPRMYFTLADKYRSNYLYAEHKINFSYFIYRGFLTPSDVSIRWYQYFSLKDNKHLGFVNFLPFSRIPNSKPNAEIIGDWAYKKRFPNRYLYNVSANSSFDADAFSRFGFVGVFIVSILIFIIRIGSALLVKNNPLSILFYSIIVFMLSFFPCIASTQAILGAHGLFLPILIMIYLRFKNSSTVRQSI